MIGRAASHVVSLVTIEWSLLLHIGLSKQRLPNSQCFSMGRTTPTLPLLVGHLDLI